MKRLCSAALLFLFLWGMTGCLQGETPEITAAYPQTSENAVESCIENGEELVLQTYYALSDGTWKTEEEHYQYRCVITGRLHGAAKDSTYTYLSNLEEITFDEAWKASGLSSNLEDYFDDRDATLVAIQ